MGEARVARTELADYGTPGRRYDLLEVDHVRLAFFDEGTHHFGSLNSVLVVKTINIPRQQLETPTGVIKGEVYSSEDNTTRSYNTLSFSQPLASNMLTLVT